MATPFNSPNWHWERLGYTVDRFRRRGGGRLIRIVRDPHGRVVLHDASYEEEMAYISSLNDDAA
ncbi:hypothetical protein [Salinicola sp. DM10]|uniref:hypothetical protein n=1 Tax=Salinicola sp. DM10 TaxID=2815721 RepID=UPI001A8C2879|nr:hypothetical protein [Salinicola sp. DM10]MCE3025762.1 hypothetical protein [Salinicola sp. DM10]